VLPFMFFFEQIIMVALSFAIHSVVTEYKLCMFAIELIYLRQRYLNDLKAT